MSYKSGVFCFSEKPVDALKFDTMVSSFAETTAQAICSSLLAAPIDETEIQSKIVQTRMYLEMAVTEEMIGIACRIKPQYSFHDKKRDYKSPT